MNPAQIGTNNNCKCAYGKNYHATIRLTLKCTQTCSHCCFECSPQKETHMSVDMAKKIALFLVKNKINSTNLMGGEIFCNPNWREILDVLVPATKYTRIVSNGDWAINGEKFAEYLTKFNNCYVSLSKDKWHTNKNIIKAKNLLIKNKILYNISNLKESEFNLVPIGRAEFSSGLYSMFGCYCYNPEKHYSFLIDEVGKIFKCDFGVWDYDYIYNYLTGGFKARFKEFNKVFYGQFMASCSRCIRGYELYCK